MTAVAVSRLLSFTLASLSHSKSSMWCWCLLKYFKEIPSIFLTTSSIQGCGVFLHSEICAFHCICKMFYFIALFLKTIKHLGLVHHNGNFEKRPMSKHYF